MVHVVETKINKAERERAELLKQKEILEVLISIKNQEIELFKDYYLGDMTKEEYDKKMDVLKVLKRVTEFVKKTEDEKKGEN